MKYKYGLSVMCMDSNRPMREFGIGVSDTLPPSQEDILRWCNKEYAVICWFSITNIDECIKQGMTFNNYFEEVL